MFHKWEVLMNKEQFEGKWKQFKGKVKEKWGKLTDDDLARVNGKFDQFVGVLQERYGYKKEEAEKAFKNWNWGSTLNHDESDVDEEDQDK